MSLGFEIAGHSSFTWSVFLTQFQSVFEHDRDIDAPKRITRTMVHSLCPDCVKGCVRANEIIPQKKSYVYQSVSRKPAESQQINGSFRHFIELFGDFQWFRV